MAETAPEVLAKEQAKTKRFALAWCNVDHELNLEIVEGIDELQVLTDKFTSWDLEECETANDIIKLFVDNDWNLEIQEIK